MTQPQRLHALTEPGRFTARTDVLSWPCPVPKSAGLYAWHLRGIQDIVDTTRCVQHEGLSLAYVGIAPKAPPQNGTPPSKQSLRTRILCHYRGNASTSTLRLSLGCLLAQSLGIELQVTGNSHRLTFGAGEAVLSDWMAENAFVVWAEIAEPWAYEEALIHRIDVPLNLEHNAHHPFAHVLKKLRADARAAATAAFAQAIAAEQSP